MRNFVRAAIIAAAACAPGIANGQAMQAAPEWRLAAKPKISIGVADGDERYTFTEVFGAMRTRAGGVVISDREPPLVQYDAKGIFVRRLGGRGSGPGELRHVVDPAFAYRGDSIAIWDADARRLSVFDTTGRFVRGATVLIPRVYWGPGTIPSQSCCRASRAFRDGSVLLEFPAMIPNTPGPNRYASLTLVRVSADGQRSDTIGSFVDAHYRYDATAPNRIRRIRLSQSYMYTLVGDTIIGGNGSGQWLQRIVPGAPPDTIRLAGSPVRVTDALKASYAQAWRDAQKARPERFEGGVESLFDGEHAEFAPAYAHVLSDASGNVWLAQWSLPFSSTPREYHVYSTRGRPVARIKIPPLVGVAHIGADDITLIETDDAGVQYIRVYDIVKAR
jgi:hypothetical protein